MHIGILGPLLVRSDDGRPCLPGGEKQRLLLSLLLLHAPRAVSVDRLVEAMWGERLPDDPTAALRTQLSRLRACLARAGASSEVLHSESRGYRLDTTAFDIDAARFEGGPEECIHPARPTHSGTAKKVVTFSGACSSEKHASWPRA